MQGENLKKGYRSLLDHILIRASVYVLLSVLVACVTFGLLSSSGKLSGKGYTFGGAATGFLATLIILLRFDKQNSQDFRSATIVGGFINDEKEYSEDYIAQIIDAIRDANSSIKLHFPMLCASSKGDIAMRVNKAIKFIAEKVSVTVITCAEYDRVAGAFELNTLDNVTVLFSPALGFSDLRFTLIDIQDVVIGVNPNQNENTDYEPSTEWVRLQSIKLAQILNSYFDDLCIYSEAYDDYVRKRVKQCAVDYSEDHKLIAKNLALPEEEVLRLIGK